MKLTGQRFRLLSDLTWKGIIINEPVLSITELVVPVMYDNYVLGTELLSSLQLIDLDKPPISPLMQKLTTWAQRTTPEPTLAGNKTPRSQYLTPVSETLS